MLSQYRSTTVIFMFFLTGCTSIKEPYSTILHHHPSIVKTSVGSVEVWKWRTNAASKGTAYLIPGFPGSSLENAPLGQELTRRGYSVHLINPPGHGQNNSGNILWSYSFPQYGRALNESINQLEAKNPFSEKKIIIAHSTGAEMVFQLLQKQITEGRLTDSLRIVLINPWLPSLSNHPIPWMEDDEDILKFSPWLVKVFGPLSKQSTHNRLFKDPRKAQNSAYLDAHEKLTENLGGWWPFNQRFVRLLRGTTRTQSVVLSRKKSYEFSKRETIQLNKELKAANIHIIIINSSENMDQIIPTPYKQALNKSLRSKLPSVNIRFSNKLNGGHMLQVEQLQQVLKEITKVD